MPFNNAQAEKIPKDLGLEFKWTNPEHGANELIVEGVISYKPFSCKLKDLRTGKSFNSDTTNKFRELCEELAKNK